MIVLPMKHRNLFISICLIGFIVLGFMAHQTAYFGGDLWISHALQSIHNPIFSEAMNLVSEIGDDYHLGLIIALTVASLVYYGLKLEAIRTAVYSSVGFLIGSLSKNIVNRPRPGSAQVTIQEVLKDKSFPSLHVLLFTVFFGYMLYLSIYKIKTAWLKSVVATVSIFLILTIGISRIYLGAHWASDTLGGYLMGAVLITLLASHAKR